MSSGKKNPDNHNDDCTEKTNERVEQAEEEEADDDKESVGLDASEEITYPCRRESHHDFWTIQGRNWDEIEGRQRNIDMGNRIKNNGYHPGWR